MLRDLESGTFLRLSDNDSWLFQLLDGSHSLVELVQLSEQRFGATGPARLARLLTDLGERGFLEGVAGGQPLAEAPTSRWRKLVKPREKVFTGRRAADRVALPRGRVGVLHAAGAVVPGGADRRRASRRSWR